MGVGIILLWGGAFAREEKSLWLYSGAFATMLPIVIMLVTLRRRRWERTARLLRFRADLRRLDADYAGSADDLRDLVRLTPWDDAAWAELSDDLASDGKLDAALDAMGQAARLDPRYDEYHMLEASLAIRLGRLDAARTALECWTELDGVEPDDPRLVIYRAALDLAEGRRDRAESSLRTILLDEDGQSFEFLDTDKALEGVKELLPGRD
jgi:tetratricopeptide (TPR) repeat protein